MEKSNSVKFTEFFFFHPNEEAMNIIIIQLFTCADFTSIIRFITTL